MHNRNNFINLLCHYSEVKRLIRSNFCSYWLIFVVVYRKLSYHVQKAIKSCSMRKFYLNIIWIFLVTSFYTAKASDSEVEYDIHIKNHHFIPSTLEVPEGTKIILKIHNDDETIEEFESIELKREKIVLGHSQIKIILAPLQSGEYKFFGEFHQDTAQGKIIVKKEEKEKSNKDD